MSSTYTRKVGAYPPDTNWVRCPCCHLKFSSRSLPFHVEACIRQKSGSWEMLPCPICHESVKGSDFKLHLINDCVFRHVGEKRSQRSGNEYDSQIEVMEGIELVACEHCHRRFASHRLEKHVQVCVKQLITPKREVYDARAKRTPMREPPSSRWSQTGLLSSTASENLSFSIGGRRSIPESTKNRRQQQPLVPAMMSRKNSNAKLNIEHSNAPSFGNPMVRVQRVEPRPTYHHY